MESNRPRKAAPQSFPGVPAQGTLTKANIEAQSKTCAHNIFAMSADLVAVENRLWATADQLWANTWLKGVLPRGYNLLPNATLVELLRLLAPLDLAGDAFGKVYEYFLGNFAMKEGQKGGVFSLIGTLDRKNLILRTTHDLLLPKLISGELDVSDLPEPETLAV